MTSPRSHTVIVNISGGLVHGVERDASLTKIGDAVVRTHVTAIDRMKLVGQDIRQAVQRTLGE